MRLFFDIETSPNIGFFWRTGHEIDVGFENIIKERAIICICWKWEKKKSVHSLTWDSKQNDKKMLSKFLKELEKADEVIAHNGDKFDVRWIRGRCILHGLPMPPKIVTVDTYKEARRLFNLNSNKLDYIARYLNVGGKIQTGGFETWRKIVLENDEAALRKMVKYCKNDVAILERVWDVMNPYMTSKTHRGNFTNQCPECGSDILHIKKTVITASGTKTIQLRCITCGKYHTIPYSKLNKKKPI